MEVALSRLLGPGVVVAHSVIGAGIARRVPGGDTVQSLGLVGGWTDFVLNAVSGRQRYGSSGKGELLLMLLSKTL